MNKQAQGAQWSPREQGMLNAKYGGHQKHHYVPLGDEPTISDMRSWEPWAALALVIAVIGVINFGYLVF